jgi:integrase
MKLTAKAVNALTLPPGKTDVIHFDNTMPGFGYRLRASAGGGKVLRSWICQYKRAGRTSRMFLGNAEVIGAEQARLAAKKALGAVAMGQDPAGDRRARRDRDQNTMRALVEEFLVAKERQLRPRSFVELRRYLTTGYFKPLHNMPVDTITRRDVSARILAIAHESGDPTAVRAKEALSNFFVWARRMGLCEQNPTIDTAQPEAGKPRERVLDDSELSAIWRAAGGDEYGKIVRLLILTGCRRAEIGDMCWSEIDLDKGTWTLPAKRSKNGRAHTLPILPAMREIIESVPRLATRDQLFGQHSHGFTAWHLGKPKLDQRSGITIPWLLHDIRRSVATRMCDIGVAPHVVEQILNHQSGHKRGPAGIYNRSSYEREVRAALATWHDHLRTVVEGGERKVVAYPTGGAISGTVGAV